MNVIWQCQSVLVPKTTSGEQYTSLSLFHFLWWSQLTPEFPGVPPAKNYGIVYLSFYYKIFVVGVLEMFHFFVIFIDKLMALLGCF